MRLIGANIGSVSRKISFPSFVFNPGSNQEKIARARTSSISAVKTRLMIPARSKLKLLTLYRIRLNSLLFGNRFWLCTSIDHLGRFLHRFDDRMVASATADIAFKFVANDIGRWIRIAVQQRRRRHDHPGCAITTLDPMFFPESALNRMEHSARCKTFDRSDGTSVRLDREKRATLDANAINEHSARTTLTGFAANMRPGHTEMVAEKLNEQHSRLDLGFALAAIDRNRDLNLFH